MEHLRERASALELKMFDGLEVKELNDCQWNEGLAKYKDFELDELAQS